MTESEKVHAKLLEQFIDGLNLRHFSGKEFTPYWDSARNGVKNTLPHASLWPNIVRTLQVLNTLRNVMKAPIYLTSTYRSPQYNRQLEGAATQSQHLRFNAIDFFSNNFSPRAMHQALTEFRNGGMFKGGLGLYKTFVHIDTRGTNADWKGASLK